ncbi:hypothetical protein SASPL_126991 [Salvia splendens]|uniref:Uncharacterized protein n=1 Tax=Salvia splendens TaxID=180675 RepID=A0A8X8XLU7_SALSN|nr:hypothetical protein SASPL_126991 [Salvia splendens]
MGCSVRILDMDLSNLRSTLILKEVVAYTKPHISNFIVVGNICSKESGTTTFSISSAVLSLLVPKPYSEQDLMLTMSAQKVRAGNDEDVLIAKPSHLWYVDFPSYLDQHVNSTGKDNMELSITSVLTVDLMEKQVEHSALNIMPGWLVYLSLYFVEYLYTTNNLAKAREPLVVPTEDLLPAIEKILDEVDDHAQAKLFEQAFSSSQSSA